ncbi:MAG TPA: hypothetical protein VHT30_11050 [Acidimicrobiales bacterium]|nr:hypothetical protein [Acidimicrobiales bacterium]
MTAPDYVPLAGPDRIRPIDRLPVPRAWQATRPADEPSPIPPKGAKFGATGPDLGYGLKLARRFRDKLELTEGEDAEDAIAGCFVVGGKRAATFGRAPVIFDMELAFTLWGFLGDAPEGLIAFRKPLFQSAGHEYWEQRQIVDKVKDSTLRLTPAEVRAKLGDWKSLIAVGS